MDGTAAAAGIEPEPRSLRVLVLDNDRTMRDLLAFALRSRGLEAVAVGEVDEAEAALEESDGLLLDFQLGGGHTGAEVARRWAVEQRLPPFWLVTGMPEDPEVQSLKELRQLIGVVGKPFSLLDLAEGVDNTLRKLAPSAGGEEPLSLDTETTYVPLEPQPSQRATFPPELLVAERDPEGDLHSKGPASV